MHGLHLHHVRYCWPYSNNYTVHIWGEKMGISHFFEYWSKKSTYWADTQVCTWGEPCVHKSQESEQNCLRTQEGWWKPNMNSLTASKQWGGRLCRKRSTSFLHFVPVKFSVKNRTLLSRSKEGIIWQHQTRSALFLQKRYISRLYLKD